MTPTFQTYINKALTAQQRTNEPVAWWNREKDVVSTDPVHRNNPDRVPLYAYPQPNLQDKAVQHRLATQWGYVKADATLIDEGNKTDPCPGCAKGTVCRTFACGRLKLQSKPTQEMAALIDENQRLRAELKFNGAHRQPMPDFWIFTSEYNDYNQHGEYFVEAFFGKPTNKQIQELGFSETYAKHVLKGGGREGYEDTWYNLKKHKAVLSADTTPALQYDQQELELCKTCGWKATIPGEGCLNCERKPTAWLDLTDAEIGEAIKGHVEGNHMLPYGFAKAIQAALRKKNNADTI